MSSTSDGLKWRCEKGLLNKRKREYQTTAGYFGVILLIALIGFELNVRFTWNTVTFGSFVSAIAVFAALAVWERRIAGMRVYVLWTQVHLVRLLAMRIAFSLGIYYGLIVKAELYWLGSAVLLTVIIWMSYLQWSLFEKYRRDWFAD